MRRYTPQDVREMQTAPGFWPVRGAGSNMRKSKPVVIDRAFPLVPDPQMCACRWIGGTVIDSRSCPIHTEDKP